AGGAGDADRAGGARGRRRGGGDRRRPAGGCRADVGGGVAGAAGGAGAGGGPSDGGHPGRPPPSSAGGRPMTPDYPRDLVGYGRTPPRAGWPNGAKLALQFVINYEEGGENSILDGDPASEAFLSEIV